MRSLASASVALATLFFFGCASLPPPTVAIDDEFRSGAARVEHVLLLPANVSVAVFGDNGPAPPPVMLEASQRVRAVLVASAENALARGGYTVVGKLDWDGTAWLPDGRRIEVLDAAAMGQLHTALAEDRAPPADLLARARDATGADAALAVAGFGEDVPWGSPGDKVAEGIFIALFIVVVAAFLILSQHSGGKRPSVGHGGGGAVHFAHPVFIPLPAGHVHGPACNLSIGVHNGFFYAPAGAPPPPAPPESSGLAVSMKLISVRDGRVLWRADQRAQGSPRERDFVHEMGTQVARSLRPAR